MKTPPGFSLGIYEKALPKHMDWPKRLTTAAKLGFDYLEMSIDPSAERLNRLNWPWEKRRDIRHVMEDTQLPIRSICLSASRRYPLGSSSLATRDRALEIIRKVIDLASDLGVRLIQVAGYDTYNQPSDSNSHQHYFEGLQQAVIWASEKSILLGLENQEQGYIVSPKIAVDIISKIGSPYLGLYMDVGNLVVNNCDVISEVEASKGYLFGVHIKDAKPGKPRYVPLGEGDVPFDIIFKKLMTIGFHGPVTIEMWNEELQDAESVCAKSREWLAQRLESAWLAYEAMSKL